MLPSMFGCAAIPARFSARCGQGPNTERAFRWLVQLPGQSKGYRAGLQEFDFVKPCAADKTPCSPSKRCDDVAADTADLRMCTRQQVGLERLLRSGPNGIWRALQWGAVEREAGVYDWSGYRALFEAAQGVGLKVQAVMSFHACGGNVGDSTQIPLPHWVLQVREQRSVRKVVHQFFSAGLGASRKAL